MYPDESRWETGAVVDLAGTNATARARWMVRFGHPGKQRARPEVVLAIRDALRRVTGTGFDSPEGLEGYLAQADVQAQVERSRRRR
jgi:hypothetical protein